MAQGDRTRSHACSDKIARWNVVGVQGALLSLLLEESIFLDSLVVGSLFHEEALDRSLHQRVQPDHLPPAYQVHELTYHPTTVVYERTKSHLESEGVEPTSCPTGRFT